tara:strand:- start:8930 stop:9109 length:180 start_codon:yes stop_codon:yes gene_type:complete
VRKVFCAGDTTMKVEISVAAAAKIFKEIEEPCSPECRDPPEADKSSLNFDKLRATRSLF